MPRKNPNSKQLRLERNFAKAILQYISGRRYSPLTAEELQSQLGIPENLKKVFLKALDSLVKEQVLSIQRERYLLNRKKTNLATGPISVHAVKGFGFVKSGDKKEIFIPRHATSGAVDGDTVEVEITDITTKGPEGRVIAILKRSRTHLGATIVEKSEDRFIAYAPLLGTKKTVLVRPCKKIPLEPGDRIICQVLDWTNEEEAVDAQVVRKIGHISDPSCDIPAAIEEFELPKEFTKEAIEEAEAFGTRVSDKSRLDLTELECVTIDPATAKDFDDAISLTKTEDGLYCLGVHIADAAWYVKAGSELDSQAYLRCNSTYFPGFCLPMLPEALSNGLCSLKPNVKRLAISVLAKFDQNGDLLEYSIERSIIRSRKRFSYEEAFAILEKAQKSSYLPLLETMVELCHLFKKKRMDRGSIDFAMSEGVVVVDPSGVPQKIKIVEYDITHQMIEEFMLKANELVAIHLSKSKPQLIYRIHEEPSVETFEDFYSYARALGFSLADKPTHIDIQKLFAQAKNSPLAPQLSVSFIRSMKLACYSPDNIGHYGLALEHYCHFTSPIRRYSDLIIQRLLCNEENPDCDLTEIARTCSEKERISFRAESSVVLLKKLRLAAAFHAENPEHTYIGTVTRVKPFGLFFEIPEFALEGSIHVSEIGREFFEYNPHTLAFRGTRSGKTFSCGSPIYLRLSHIDLIRQQSKWIIMSPPSDPRSAQSK